MNSTPTTTRERLIAAAERRFYRDGFWNVGIDQIYAEVGISKTAFYKHFASKEDLMLAVIIKYDHWTNGAFRDMLQQHETAPIAEQVRALFDMVEQFTESEGYQGCIFINATIEFPLAHDPIHVAAARAKQTFEEIVYDLALRAGSCRAREFASALCLIMEGAYVTRHVSGNRQVLAVARQLGEMLVAQFFPQTIDMTPFHAS